MELILNRGSTHTCEVLTATQISGKQLSRLRGVKDEWTTLIGCFTVVRILKNRPNTIVVIQ